MPGAGSLALAGATTDRDTVLRAVLRSLEQWYEKWRSAGGDPAASGLQETYAAGCATLGRVVRAELPGGTSITGGSGGGRRGRASGPGHGGGRTAAGGSGDIVHLRPA